MEIVITESALQSYLNLKHKHIFTKHDYDDRIRPDVELLKNYPTDPKFQNSKFFGPASDINGKLIPYGFKMKWHNLGPGKVQLRLLIAIIESELKGALALRSFLLQAYVKDNDSVDKREMAKIKNRIRDISQGTYHYRGLL